MSMLEGIPATEMSNIILSICKIHTEQLVDPLMGFPEKLLRRIIWEALWIYTLSFPTL